MKKRQICMIAYTNYRSDSRVRREIETLTTTGGFEVSSIVLREEAVAKSYESDGANIIELNVKKYSGRNVFNHFISYIKFFFLAFFKCSGLLFAGKLDYVHVHNMPNFFVFAGLLPRLSGKRVILDIHDSTPETYYARYGNNPNKFLFRFLCGEEALCCWFANMVICVNHAQRDALVNRGIPSCKITIVMNIPDPNLFKALSVVRDNTSRRNIRLSYHGTVAKRLGVDLAIMAFARLFSENPDMKFYIIGDGEELAEYMALSENLGLDKAIRFSGKKLPLESLPGILMDIDIGIVSNRKNSATELMLPVKMLEYVALGIPVVAPKLKTIERYFSDEMVRYFEPEDIDSLARAISDLCRDGTKRKIQAEKAKAFLDQYGWEKNASDLIRLYK